MGLAGGEGEAGDAQIACMCDGDDGAVGEGDLDAGVVCRGSDIAKVTGYFKKRPVAPVSIMMGGEGTDSVELMCLLLRFKLLANSTLFACPLDQ
jgi:hypothetical protein